MVSRYKELGGKYLSGTRAVKIGGRSGAYEISLDNGEKIACDDVICCIDPVTATKTLFDGDVMPKSFARKLRAKEKYPVFSSVHFAFSANRDDVPFTGTSFFPCRRHDIGSVNRDRMMLREFSAEPSFAPAGKTVLQTMFMTDEKTSRSWICASRGEGYAEAKASAAARAAERIKERYPSLGGSLELIDSWTPATLSRYLGSYCGSYMSFALTPGTVPASFPGSVKGARGVYFASGWSRSPGGVPNAALAGKRAAEEILG